jgi:hypothetical protein
MRRLFSTIARFARGDVFRVTAINKNVCYELFGSHIPDMGVRFAIRRPWPRLKAPIVDGLPPSSLVPGVRSRHTG